MSLRVGLADWRDWKAVEGLQREGAVLARGGLYELLNWPIYHVHVARYGAAYDGAPIVGYTSVALFPDGSADDLGTVVAESARGRGVANALRAAQVRDLLVMGWDALYVAVPTTSAAGLACATAHFGAPIGTCTVPGVPPFTYFGAPLAALHARLTVRSERPTHELSATNRDRLLQKAEAARAELARLSAQGTLTVQKATLRAQAQQPGLALAGR